VIVPNHPAMNIDSPFLKITRFLLLPITFLLLAESAGAALMSELPSINFLVNVPFHQEILSTNHNPSQISQEGLLPKRGKSKKQNKDEDHQKKENCINEVNDSKSEVGFNPIKSYQQLKGILEEVDMMVSGWM